MLYFSNRSRHSTAPCFVTFATGLLSKYPITLKINDNNAKRRWSCQLGILVVKQTCASMSGTTFRPSVTTVCFFRKNSRSSKLDTNPVLLSKLRCNHDVSAATVSVWGYFTSPSPPCLLHPVKLFCEFGWTTWKLDLPRPSRSTTKRLWGLCQMCVSCGRV